MFLRRPAHLFYQPHHHTLFPPRRPSSTLIQSLLRRPLPILHDYLTPQPSHLLTTTLSSFLPFLSYFAIKNPHHLPSTTHPSPLPPGHHLIYFPPLTLPSTLLPDGTDTLHSPGPPWTQRLWAGGHVSFLSPVSLNKNRAVIVEKITSVRFTSGSGNEGEKEGKVFISIERRISLVPDESESESSIRNRVWPKLDTDTDASSESEPGDSKIIERRDLCFLTPTNSHSPSAVPPTTRTRVVKPPQSPEFVHSLTPSQILLARFSGLSYNAHLIHLDPEYTRTVYGFRDLLVHGPLLLILILTCLEHEIGKFGVGIRAGQGANEEGKRGRGKWAIKEISYKNLAPVYVGESIRVCGRRKREKIATPNSANPITEGGTNEGEQAWEVWIEKDAKDGQPAHGGDAGGGGEGQASLVVKGTVRTQYMSI